MNKLLRVAEGILDGAAQEYIDCNLSSVKAVQDYAENGCDVVLNDEDAELVLSVCKKWVNGTEDGSLNGTNDYYYTVKKILLGEDATL